MSAEHRGINIDINQPWSGIINHVKTNVEINSGLILKCCL